METMKKVMRQGVMLYFHTAGAVSTGIRFGHVVKSGSFSVSPSFF